MLKLNTVNGKFDIVFSTDPVTDGKRNSNLGFTYGSNANRVKGTDNKSLILPKDNSSKASKSVKNSIVKKRNESERGKAPRTEGRKIHARTPISTPTKRNVDKQKIKNSNRNAARKKEDSFNRVDVKKKSEVLSTNQRNNIDTTLTEEMMSKGTYVLRDSKAADLNTGLSGGVISRGDLHDIFQSFFDDNSSHRKVEPLDIPGLELPVNSTADVTSEESPSSHPQQSPNKDTTKKNHSIPVTESEYNPWGRPGCGAPRKSEDSHHQQYSQKSNSKKNQSAVEDDYNPWGRPGCGAPMKPIASSSPISLKNNHEYIIRDFQSNREEEYNPWGRPGCGARLNDSQSILGNLRNNNSERPNQNEYHDKDSQNEDFPDKKILHSSLNISESKGMVESDGKVGSFSAFGRGQNISQSELQELQNRRMKQLEHQNAIKLQVEEKRRLKQLEKERQLKEEQEAEMRFQKEQEHIQKMLEEEKRKQKEEEEKKRKKQEFLEESIRQASLEARKVKESMRKDNKSDFSNITNGDQHSSTQRRLHHEDDVIVPAHKHSEKQLNEDDAIVPSRIFNMSESQSSGVDITVPTHTLNDKRFKEDKSNYENSRIPVSVPSRAQYHSQASDRTFTLGLRNENYSPNVDITAIKKNTVDENFLECQPSISLNSNMIGEFNNEASYQVSSSKTYRSYSNNHEILKHQNHVKSKEKVHSEIENKYENNKLVHDKELKKTSNDYLIPFHRTQTTDLTERHKLISSTEFKRAENEKYNSLKRYSTPEQQTTAASPRQQEILNQLNALRQGLLQKEQECRLENYQC